MTEHTNSSKTTALAQALMLEQVQFFKQQLSIKNSPVYFQQFIQLFMQHADEIKLHEVVELEQLQAVVKRYAFEMQLGAGLLEFIGEIAQRIYLSAMESPVELQDLVSDYQFEMWLSKLLEMEHISHYLNQFLRTSPSVQQLCQYIATSTLEQKLPKFLTISEVNQYNFEWQYKLKKFSFLQQQRLEQKLETWIAGFIHEQLTELSLLSAEDLESLVRHIWEDLRHKKMHEFMKQLTPLDVEEFFVLIYEYWKELRQSKFMQDLILYGVEVFYDFHKDQSLLEVLSAIGLNESDLQTEALRFYPKVMDAFNQHGILEPLLKALLEPFYQSPQTLELIQQHIDK